MLRWMRWFAELSAPVSCATDATGLTLPCFAGQQDLHNLDAHLTNTCHISRSSHKEYQEEEVVKLSSELPQASTARELACLDTTIYLANSLHMDIPWAAILGTSSRSLYGCFAGAITGRHGPR